MFDHHRKSPWFAEKYDPAPEFVKLRTRVRKEGWKNRLHTFLLDLDSGKFDPDLNEPEAEPSSPVKDNTIANGDSSSADAAINPNGNAAPIADDSKAAAGAGDDDMQFNMDTEEDAGADANGKTSTDNRRNNRGDEVSVMPEGNQVMIRTIPPDIGRVKLEDACGKIPGFVYLALGDPLQKRNYYRAGWLRFRDDADMGTVLTELSEKKIEGFKLHVTHNVRPFTNRIRYAPEVASRPERLEKDLVNVKTLAGILEEQANVLRKTKVTADQSGSSENQDVPMPEAEVDDEEPEPKEKGSDAVERRIEKVMADMRDQGLVDPADEKAYEAKKTMVSLDLYIAYLRAAYNTCYYCCVVTDHLEELQRKCVKHERKPLSKTLLEDIKAAEVADKQKKESGESDEKNGPEEKKEKENKNKEKLNDNRDWKRNDDRWLEWLDSKIALLINRDGVDPRDYGGKSYDEELTKAVEPYIKQEDEGKFRCKTCQKLFKATSFVEKHIANKHPDLVKSLDELPYFNNFALDPHRIQPFAHPPAAVGNSNQAPPQAYGIQGPHHSSGGGDPYGRSGQHFGSGGSYPPASYPPPPPYNGQWDHHAYAGVFPPPASFPLPQPPRCEDNRRLSDRLGGFAPETSVPPGAGLPPKPTPAALDSALSSGNNPRRGGRGGGSGGPPPPPPPDAKEDPRATAGKRVSYHDMDLVAEGDVELFY